MDDKGELGDFRTNCAQQSVTSLMRDYKSTIINDTINTVHFLFCYIIIFNVEPI